jgi:hypothetical protein
MYATQPSDGDDTITTTTVSATSSGTPSANPAHTNDGPDEEEEVEESLSDVDTRVLRAMLQEQKLNMNDEEELRKLLERGTVKQPKKKIIENKNNKAGEVDDDESLYSSQVLKTLTDTKLWKKLSLQANDLLESVSIWVSNKVEQDVKVLAALGLFAWDRVQQDVARALPATSSSSSGSSAFLPKQLLLLTNASAYDINTRSSEQSTQSSRNNVREQMNRPEDEIKSVSRELFAILSGERTKYQRGGGSSLLSAKQQQRGLRTVAPAGTAYSGERQRRALQQKRKVEQSKKNIATNIGSNVVDSVWELRQEMKSEVNVPGYKTEPIRNVIAAGVGATNQLLQGVRDRAQLVAAATVRQKDESLLLSQSQQEQQQQQMNERGFSIETDSDPTATKPNIEIESPMNMAMSNNDVTQEEQRAVDFDENVVDPPMTTAELSLFRDVCTERERIMNQLTTCIDVPTSSWLTPDIVDTLDTMDVITSPGMQNSITKMILLRDEIYKNHFLGTTETGRTAGGSTVNTEGLSRSSLDATVNDILAIRTAIDYLYNCTVQDVSELVAEEIRYFILFESSSSNNDKELETLPLILRIEEEVQNLDQMQQQQSVEEIVIDSKNVFVVPNDIDPVGNGATATTKKSGFVPKSTTAVIPDILDVIPDVVFTDTISRTRGMVNENKKMDPFTEDDYDDDKAIAGYVAEIITEDDFDSAVGNTFKQVYDVKDDDSAISEEKSAPNIFLIIVLRSIDVLLFVTEKLLTVGIPGTITIVTNMVKRIDEMNRLGLGTKGWKELGNVAKAKGRY